MAGIRGVRNPVPQSGSKPTGIFSTSGSQKMDKRTAKHAGMTATAFKTPRKDPVKRDNRLKKGS